MLGPYGLEGILYENNTIRSEKLYALMLATNARRNLRIYVRLTHDLSDDLVQLDCFFSQAVT